MKEAWKFIPQMGKVHILEKMEHSEVFYLMSKSKFSLTLCSDLDYEGMVVDIKYGSDRIALAHYDKGIDDMEIQWLITNSTYAKES